MPHIAHTHTCLDCLRHASSLLLLRRCTAGHARGQQRLPLLTKPTLAHAATHESVVLLTDQLMLQLSMRLPCSLLCSSPLLCSALAAVSCGPRRPHTQLQAEESTQVQSSTCKQAHTCTATDMRSQEHPSRLCTRMSLRWMRRCSARGEARSSSSSREAAASARQTSSQLGYFRYNSTHSKQACTNMADGGSIACACVWRMHGSLQRAHVRRDGAAAALHSCTAPLVL